MDIGMSELLVIGIVALIVIGPRDLPEMFRQLGRMTAKMRAMAREFSRAMEQAANETGVKDVARDLQAVTSAKSLGLNAVKGAVDKFEKWDPIKNAAKPATPATPATPMAAAKTLVPPAMPASPVPPSAAAPALMPTATPAADLGPATAALYKKKAARAAILSESAAKLQALNAAPEVPAKPARRKKAEPVAEASEPPADEVKTATRTPRRKRAAAT